MVTENQDSNKPVKVVTLEYPYTFGTKKITECIFERRPKAKDLKGMNLTAMKAEDQFLLLGKTTNLSTPEIEDMDLADFQIVCEALTSFLPSTHGAGKVI